MWFSRLLVNTETAAACFQSRSSLLLHILDPFQPYMTSTLYEGGAGVVGA